MGWTRCWRLCRHHPAGDLFATTAVNHNSANGLIIGESAFFWKQIVATMLTAVYVFVFTYATLWIINKITPVKVSQKELIKGIYAAILSREHLRPRHIVNQLYNDHFATSVT